MIVKNDIKFAVIASLKPRDNILLQNTKAKLQFTEIFYVNCNVLQRDKNPSI